MTRTMAFLTAATLLLAFGLPSKAQEQPCTRSQVRMAVVHADDATGEQHLLGVRKALAELDSDKRICPVPIPYRGDRDGTKKLVEVITKKEAEIILGPTDSGAFQGAVEQEAELSQYQIPVISSLVTATGGNDRNGWFFRTNVDNKQRIARILDRTAPFAISSLGILYADTGFGRAAETQLRDDLATRFPPIYVTAVFEDNPESRRGAVKKILAQRPEALGIFGLAEDLTLIFEEIDEQARTVKYKPMSFTIVDASTVALSDHLLYWVSTLNGEADSSSEEEPKGEANPQGDKASGSEEQAISEIAALAYDTTGFLLQQLGSVTRQTFVPDDFRNDFAHLLRAGAAKPGELTGMDFDNFRNKANPGVFYRENGKIQKFEANLTFYEMTQHKFELVQRRFGDWPFLYAGASIVLCLMLTIVDVKRKYEGKYRKVLRHMWIYILCGAHVLILLALLLYLGETGKIQYDDWVAVLALAVAPTTLFRTTIVETTGGKAIGVKQYYERVLAWLNRRILDARHPRDTRRVAVLTYYNPYETMRLKLRANYDQQGDEQAPKLKANLDEKLESIESNATGIERLLRKRGGLRSAITPVVCLEGLVPQLRAAGVLVILPQSPRGSHRRRGSKLRFQR